MSLRERALEARRVREEGMTNFQIRERRKANKRLRRVATFRLNWYFNAKTHKAIWHGDGKQIAMTVDGIEFVARAAHQYAPVELWACGAQVSDLVDLGRAIARSERLG